MSSDTPHNLLPEACIVCGHNQLVIGDQTHVLGAFPATLIACQQCGHEWFESPRQWLEKAYSSPIANTDTGIVARSLGSRKIISSFLGFSNDGGKILDWGGGSGLLSRLLRDDGHNCYSFEPYTEPVLLSGFTFRSQKQAMEQGPYRAIIAIEVVEHLVSPKEFFGDALTVTDTLIFSTEIVDRAKYGSDWWYYSRETGQHISFYTCKSLAFLAVLCGCQYASSRTKGLHIITRNPVDLQLFKLLAGHRRSFIAYPLSQFFGKLLGRKSLMMSDHLAAKRALLISQASKSE